MTPKMTIDIWSDLMCPFCFIGKKNLDAALAQFPDRDSLSIEWHSYQLAPDFYPKAGKNAHEVLAEYKNVPVDEARQMNTYVADMAARSGITFDMDRMQWANTFHAHRLLQWAKQYGSVHALEQRLFEAVFCNGENIGTVDTLLAIAGEVGLPVTEATAILNSTAYTEEVRQDIRQSMSLGLRGVPFFLVDNQITFSGAVQPNDFLQVITESFANWRAENPQSISLDGESCGIDGICE
ncbi:DsbA family oxidoreductase [Flavobacterium amniphilum]|uniref:DsbA family oxidoreductase n=1 Tax=Flavobacterium amniphilum TaxID=1834035 RepID=UPI00202A48AD|nr:DsbA family oxidoreductase [Flavobacterium amniphilum]MCL9807025.1 DsbA family oxidoreductase [Flavobacterium amniphilum]